MLSPQVGVINAMRTGNVVFDMMIAMSIPLALQGLFKFLEWLRPRIEDFVLSFQRQEFYYTRSIDHEKVRRVGSTAAEGSQSFVTEFLVQIFPTPQSKSRFGYGTIPCLYRDVC